MTKLLIATDGSENSRLAQEFAAALPFPEKASARLVAVTPLPVTLSEFYVEDVLFQQAHQIQNTVVAPRTTAEAEKLRSSFANIATDLRIGDPAHEILASAKEHESDLIVIGARGLSAIPRILLGSVSDWICRHAPQSLLVVRPHVDEKVTQVHGTVPRRVLFAVDGSAGSLQAVKRLAAWKWPAGTTARAVLAFQKIRIFQPEQAFIDAERQHADEVLADVKSILAPAFTQVETAVLDADQITHTIVSDAESWKADLLVIGSRGMGRWERFFLGSTSLGILHHAPCSIWVEKPTQS